MIQTCTTCFCVRFSSLISEHFFFQFRPLLPLSVTYFTQCTLYNVQTSAFLDSFPMIALLTVKCINNYIALHFWNVYKSIYFWFVRVYLASIFALWKDDGFMCGAGGRWGEMIVQSFSYKRPKIGWIAHLMFVLFGNTEGFPPPYADFHFQIYPDVQIGSL